jgi:hypothetical protein
MATSLYWFIQGMCLFLYMPVRSLSHQMRGAVYQPVQLPVNRAYSQGRQT